MYEPMPYYDQCSLLLPMFGENNGTIFTDYSLNPKSVTVSGNAKTSTTQSKYYGSSVLFDGVSDSISVGNHSDLIFNTGDFTITLWVYADSSTQVEDYPRICSKGAFGTTGAWNLVLTKATGLLTFEHYTPTVFRELGTLATNTWTHIAITRESGIVKGFKDGLQQFSVSDSKDLNNTASLVIGAETNSGLSDFNGYIQDFSIFKDVAIWTSNFTPPTRLIEKSPDVTGYLTVSGGINPYSITLSLTESLAATDFAAVVTNANTGFIISKTTVSGANPTINLSTTDPCFVTLYPDYGTQWTASTAYALTDKVFPTDPTTSPYYYECTTAGTSDASEPTWPTSGTVNDGTAVWTYVEQMVQPITHGPLIPS